MFSPKSMSNLGRLTVYRVPGYSPVVRIGFPPPPSVVGAGGANSDEEADTLVSGT
jgi:hypothetical protein